MTLKQMLEKFEPHPTGNKWPGLRVTDGFMDFRIVLRPGDDNVAEVKGIRGNRAYKTYATIDLTTGENTFTRETKFHSILKELWEDPVGFTDAYGKLWRRCCFCGMAISTDESLEFGYGPICAGRWGLPWGTKSKPLEDFDLESFLEGANEIN